MYNNILYANIKHAQTLYRIFYSVCARAHATTTTVDKLLFRNDNSDKIKKLKQQKRFPTTCLPTSDGL